MPSDRWRKIDDVFARTLDRPRTERAAFLEEVCGGDAALHRAVTALLEAGEEADGLLESLDRRTGPFWRAFAADELAQVPPAPLQAGEHVGPYRLIRELGRGGMGVVYQARDTRLGRPVALKFLPPHLNGADAAKERFLHEAQAAAALDHTNICTIYEIGEIPASAGTAAQFFIAMACYEGETLKEKIARGPLPVKEALGYAAQIARGLARAHAHGIVHRDVKPPTLMVTGKYDEEHPYYTRALPLYDLLREPKKLVLVEGGHLPSPEARVPVINEWLDETLGPVKWK